MEEQAEYKTKAGRKPGFYWVKREKGYDWDIAYWHADERVWYLHGEKSNEDGGFKLEVINENRIKTPDET